MGHHRERERKTDPDHNRPRGIDRAHATDLMNCKWQFFSQKHLKVLFIWNLNWNRVWTCNSFHWLTGDAMCPLNPLIFSVLELCPPETSPRPWWYPPIHRPWARGTPSSTLGPTRPPHDGPTSYLLILCNHFSVTIYWFTMLCLLLANIPKMNCVN